MLNWRRDPVAEQRRMQLEKELALLGWMHSEIDLIDAGLPSNSTPLPTTAANSSYCLPATMVLLLQNLLATDVEFFLKLL